MEYIASSGGIAGLISIFIHIVDKIVVSKCHKRIHSSCCEKNIDIDMEIDNGSPVKQTESVPKE